MTRLDDFTKWMATVETAALGGIAYLLLNGDTALLSRLNDCQKITVMYTGLTLGLSLMISGWLFSSLGTVVTRIYAASSDDLKNTIYDIRELGIYPASKKIRLGHVLTVKHCLWVLGLIGIAIFVTEIIAQSPAPADKKIAVCQITENSNCNKGR